MKNLNKKIIPILITLLLSGCGLANNLYTSHYTVIKDLTPHGHKVRRSGGNSFPENKMGVVSLNFVAGEKPKTVGVDTLWRKINNDGTFSKRISLTYLNPFKDGRVDSMLEPGTYFLDGLRYAYNNRIISIGAFTALIKTSEQKGWDSTRKKPLWFSFNVEKGKEIIIPDISLSARCVNGYNSCDGDSFAISMKIDLSDVKESDSYKVGYKVEKNMTNLDSLEQQ